MTFFYPICKNENREIDGFDFISVLGMTKEYNWQEIWRRYLSEGSSAGSISMYVADSCYFLEMHIQKMHRIILSEKFNTNPFFLQQVIQRMTACHDHDLIISKIQAQGIDTGGNPISLACSMGNIIIDVIANRNEPYTNTLKGPPGPTLVEKRENRPIDIYDLSSALYLCQQNLSASLFRRYSINNISASPSGTPEVLLRTGVGRYSVELKFQCVPTDSDRVIPRPGNVSVATMHQVLQRMNFRHSSELILMELKKVGLSVTADQLESQFTLRRFINNTALELFFSRQD